jgi:hypothetical protein
MRRFTDAGRQALKQGNCNAAVTMALMLPDVCGSLINPEEGSKARYVKWFDEWAKPAFDGTNGFEFLNGNNCYLLRCSLIHSGKAEVDVKKSGGINNYEFFDDSGPAHKGIMHGNIVNGVLQPTTIFLRVREFSEAIFDATDRWDNDPVTATDQAIQNEKAKLLIIRSSGAVLHGAFEFITGGDPTDPRMSPQSARR